MEQPNDGVLLRDIPAAGANTYTVRNESGIWPSPPGENQWNQVGWNVIDSMGCVSYSAVHAIESQVARLFGDTTNYSERFLAKMSGTTKEGNYVSTVYDTIMQHGLATDLQWPEPQTFTWDTYYAEPSDAAKNNDFLRKYSITWRSIPESEVAQALKEAPVTAIITHDNPSHAVELLDVNTFFDTYQPYVKPLGTVHSYFQIIVTKKSMPQIKLANIKGEEGIFLAAANPTELQSLCAVFGKDISQPEIVIPN